MIDITIDIGDGWRPRHGQTDIYGNLIEDRIYTYSGAEIDRVPAEITAKPGGKING